MAKMPNFGFQKSKGGKMLSGGEKLVNTCKESVDSILQRFHLWFTGDIMPGSVTGMPVTSWDDGDSTAVHSTDWTQGQGTGAESLCCQSLARSRADNMNSLGAGAHIAEKR